MRRTVSSLTKRVACAGVLLAGLGMPLCRYTVRDIGFVDLAGEEYLLARVVREAPAGEALLNRDLGALGAALCRDTNLRVGALAASSSADDPLAQALLASGLEAAWFLHREGLNPLRFEGLDEGGVPLESLSEELKAAAKWAGSDAIRSEWTREALTSFATLWVIEGDDVTANSAAAEEVRLACAALERLESSLPRPLRYPVRVTTITAAEQKECAVTLWSLGLRDPSKRPAVVALYGRAKRAGPVLVRDEIAELEILAQLALVGSSCECETDRRWLSEPTLPLRWGQAQQERAADLLGFDPQSPMVVAEVQRILAKVQSGNPGTAAKGLGVGALLLGYRETSIEPSPLGAGGDSQTNADPPHQQPPPSLVPSSNDDWSFEAGEARRPEVVDAAPGVAAEDHGPVATSGEGRPDGAVSSGSELDEPENPQAGSEAQWLGNGVAVFGGIVVLWCGVLLLSIRRRHGKPCELACRHEDV